MYIDDYKRWLEAELEDPALTEELKKIEGQDNEIKERFAVRMRGTLPPPVASMLERNHGVFDAVPHDHHVISGVTDVDALIKSIK